MQLSKFVANKYNTQDTNGFITYKLEKMTLANGTEVYKINIYNQVTNETEAKIITEESMNRLIDDIYMTFDNLDFQIYKLTQAKAEQDSLIASLQEQINELQSR